MRATLPAILLLAACSSGGGPDAGGSGGSGGDGGGLGGAGGMAVLDPPADAGVPTFTAGTFCEVFAKSSCAWSVTCGQRTPAEEAGCVENAKHDCPRPLKFDPAAATVCLLRLESARCSPNRISRCDEAWPASVADGGGCVATRECLGGTVCVLDGGSCGTCVRPGEEGDPCPCNKATARCGLGLDAGEQCLGKLDAGAKCNGDDEACKTNRCVFKVGQGLVCVTASPGGSCSSNAGCASSLYCDPITHGCRVPETLNANCTSQEACAAYGNVCLRGKCAKVAPQSVAEFAPCTETAQCAFGLACDVRAAAPVCVRRIAFDAGCVLKGLDPWDPQCPYGAVCDPAVQRCTEGTALCTFSGYCPTGPAPNAVCTSGDICRGVSSCADVGDGGYRCLPVDQPASAVCFDPFATQACHDSTCSAGTCLPWPAAPTCP